MRKVSHYNKSMETKAFLTSGGIASHSWLANVAGEIGVSSNNHFTVMYIED